MNYKYLIFGSILIIILIIIYVKRDSIKSYFFGDKLIKDSDNVEIKTKKKKIKIKKKENKNEETINNNLKKEEPKKEYIEMNIIVSPEENNEINIGKIKINLFDDIVPKTCENFRSLSKIEYKNCNIHRIIKGFMFQSGDYENHDGTGGKSSFGGKFNDENFILKHNKRGILSMANSGPDSNGSQFFITFNETPWLDNKHVVFGEVIDGFDILDKIENIPVTNETPNYLIYINNINIVNE